MSEDEPLVDLSLFSLSPADDRHFAVHDPVFNDDQSRQHSRPYKGIPPIDLGRGGPKGNSVQAPP